jgi:hypothetical protein
MTKKHWLDEEWDEDDNHIMEEFTSALLSIVYGLIFLVFVIGVCRWIVW